VHGTFNDFTGTLSFDEKSLEGGSVVVTVQVASIDTRVEKRDNHIRSAEFFDVEQYPVISFRARAWKARTDSPERPPHDRNAARR
jgi:polyisoprenoid-binding protein YceI